MAKVSTNINLDLELKKQAQALFADFGMDLTTAVTCFLKQAVREQRIPFVIGRENPNKVTLAAIKEVEDAEKAPSKRKTYKTIDELL